nr:WYL domain-containing protein [Desulfoscipio gibsoniae]
MFKYHYNPAELAVEKLQNRIHLVEEEPAKPEWVGDIFAKLVGALKYCYRVKIRYFVAYSRQITERVVEPYGLICKRQNWYLVAFCLKRQDIQVFRVDQIIDTIPYMTEKFNYPENFKLKDHMAQSWGVINDGEVCQVRLKFSPNVAFRVKNIIYHPSQVIKRKWTMGQLSFPFMCTALLK